VIDALNNIAALINAGGEITLGRHDAVGKCIHKHRTSSSSGACSTTGYASTLAREDKRERVAARIQD
jgi:hypothetical protein